jgi:hypothetical protein
LFENFLGELKRRHVIRVAGVYTVAAWAVFQVVKTIFETLDVPKWTSTLALALLVLGLPVVLLVSWIFERTPKGAVAVTPDAPAGAPRPKLGRMDMLLLAAMVVVVGLAGAQIGGYLSGGRVTILGQRAPDKSVAVLPFVVFSAQADSEYFADGLTEEVINSLAQVPDLKVAGDERSPCPPRWPCSGRRCARWAGRGRRCSAQRPAGRPGPGWRCRRCGRRSWSWRMSLWIVCGWRCSPPVIEGILVGSALVP